MIFVFVFLFCIVSGQDEGEKCIKNGVSGTCLNIRECPSAIQDIKNRKQPQICGFSGFDTIVCCAGDSQPRPPGTTTTTRPQVTTTKRVGTTTEYTPTVPDYVDNAGGTSADDCEPISPALTSRRTGRKAWDKCIEYQERLVYPCERGVALTGDMSRGNHCMHNADELIVGGVDAAKGEFPHMALLGFGAELKYVQWLCGGAIVSENFILTAGHCIYTRDSGPVSYAMVGILKRYDEVDSTKVHKIKNILKHPEYKAPVKYNDIALLEVETPIKLGPYTVPACLHVGGSVKDDIASATGWGTTQYKGDTADILQKVILTKFSLEECTAKFPPARNMKQGFDQHTQMCYGDRTKSKDTCQRRGSHHDPMLSEDHFSTIFLYLLLYVQCYTYVMFLLC
ncbi:serine protease snake-like isoform X2 [Plodia interpunctella]|uniref:serine protease snake-like isoform X2 n=1 Tax=Plodia interpunctella TaxID=58824 RepID=UPI00236890F1|nr:serine protease snake-like isoform X2 [Plodia interpunctella]